MNETDFNFFCERQFHQDKFLLYAKYQGGVNYSITYSLDPVVMRATTDHGVMLNPFLTLTQAEAQRLSDALAIAGIRPSDEGSPHQLSAIRYHLEDMRTLVFKGRK